MGRRPTVCKRCGETGHTQKTCKSDELVCVVWRTAWQDASELSVLNGYQGVRLYARDQLDPRLMLGRTAPLPFFDDALLVLAYLADHRGSEHTVQLALPAARSLGVI